MNNIISSFYFRYVDDIVLAVHKEKVERVVELFNSYHERLKFTVDFGDENDINFLDVKLMRQERNIIFDIYKKIYQFWKIFKFIFRIIRSSVST